MERQQRIENLKNKMYYLNYNLQTLVSSQGFNFFSPEQTKIRAELIILFREFKGLNYTFNKPMFLDMLFNFIHDNEFRPIETGYINRFYKRVK